MTTETNSLQFQKASNRKYIEIKSKIAEKGKHKHKRMETDTRLKGRKTDTQE